METHTGDIVPAIFSRKSILISVFSLIFIPEVRKFAVFALMMDDDAVAMTPTTSEKDENLRKSTRKTAGQAPARLGYSAHTPSRKMVLDADDDEVEDIHASTPMPMEGDRVVQMVEDGKRSESKKPGARSKATRTVASKKSSKSTTSTAKRRAMEAELRAPRELSQIEEQEEDLRVKLERLELEKQLKKVQREKSIAQTSLEIECSEVEEAADDEDDDADMSLEASEDDSQALSESEDEHEVTEDEEKWQVSLQPRRKRISSPRYALPVKQPEAEQQENGSVCNV